MYTFMILIVHLLVIKKICLQFCTYFIDVCSLMMIVRELKHVTFQVFYCKIVYCNVVHMVGCCLINIPRGCHGHVFP